MSTQQQSPENDKLEQDTDQQDLKQAQSLGEQDTDDNDDDISELTSGSDGGAASDGAAA